MTLDPQSTWVLDLVEKAGYPLLESLSVAEARGQYENTAWRLDFEPVEMAHIEDDTVPVDGGTIGVRVYTPKSVTKVGAPTLVYLHGGGWVVGSVETHDRLCRALAARARCKIVSVDYRLAPEHPFPTPGEDAVAAFRWVVANAEALSVDAARIAIGGDSAGGNLAAVACQSLRDAGDAVQPCFQLLIYPATDFAGDYASRGANAEGYILTRTLIDWFDEHYLGSWADLKDARLSPLHAGSLEGLPPALVVTAGYDPLHDEGMAYARALSEAGVAAEHCDYPGMLHGFFNFGGAVDLAAQAVGEAATGLRHAFGVI